MFDPCALKALCMHLGRDFHLSGALGNDIRKTNVPNVRLQYRHEQLIHEMTLIRNAVAAATSIEK